MIDGDRQVFPKDCCIAPPLKIRGAKGVMKITGITPFIPLILRGKLLGKLNCYY